MSTNNLKSLDSLKDEENKIQNKNSLVSVDQKFLQFKLEKSQNPKNFFSEIQKFSESITELTIIEVTELMNIDLSWIIEETDDIDEFLKDVKKSGLTIFLPDKCYYTIFHSLIDQSRLSDIKKLRNHIEKNVKLDDECNNVFLKNKFLKNINEDFLNRHLVADSDRRKLILKIYSNLLEICCNDGRLKDVDKLDDVKFISNKLEIVGKWILDQIQNNSESSKYC